MARPRNILHADFDSFCVAAERSCNPRLIDRPVIIVGTTRHRGAVVAASREARAHGVFPAMTRDHAHGLCRDAAFLPAQNDLYRRAAKAVHDHAARYSPCIEQQTLDSLYIDLTGTETLFGKAVDTAARVRHEIQDRFKLDLTVGVAANKLVSRVAADEALPDGLCDVAPGSERHFLSPLPVQRLPGIGTATVQRLLVFNITDIGDLAAAGRAFLRHAFGLRGDILDAHARGIDDSPVGTPTKRCHHLSYVHTPPTHTNDRDHLLIATTRIVEQAAHDLRRERLRARRITVAVTFINGSKSQHNEMLETPTDLDDNLFPVAERLLIRALEKRWSVARIDLKLSRLSHGSSQLHLLEDVHGYDRRRVLADAVDTIRSRYGTAAIEPGRLRRMPVPATPIIPAK